MNLKDGVIDNSTYELDLLCPRRNYFRNVLNLVPEGRNLHPEFGTGIHEGVGYVHTHRNEPVEQQVLGAIAAFIKSYAEPEGEDHRTRAFGAKVLQAYVAKYQDDSFTIVHTPEQGFAVSLGEYTLVGRIDLVVRFTDKGGLWLLDHKTTSRMGRQFWEQFRMSSQVSLYTLAANLIFQESILGMFINGIGTAKTHHASPAKSDQYLQRQQFPRSPARLEQTRVNVCRRMDEILKRDFENPDTWPEYERNCVWKYGVCPYVDLCEFGKKAWPELMGSFEENVWNPYEMFVEKKGAGK